MARGRRNAKAELTLRDRTGRTLRAARKRIGKFAGSTRRLVGGALGGIGVGSLIGGAGLVAAFVAAGAGVVQFEEKLTRLQIQSGRTTQQMGRFRDQTGRFRDQIDSVSRRTGVARGDILQASASYVSLTGDMDGAGKSMETFARVSVASGASMEDISRTAAALQQNMKVNPGDLEKTFSIILAGGKAGAIELRKLSTLLSTITPAFAQFGTTGADGMAELGAMLQLTQQGFGSASEAVTGLQGMMNGFIKNAKRFEKAGVKIFENFTDENGKKVMRNLRDIVIDLGDSKLAKDPTRLTKAFGRIEGKRAFDQLVKNKGALDDLIDTTRRADDVGRDYATFQESTAGKLKTAYNSLKQSVAEAFTPERIETFVEGVGKAIGAMNDLGGAIEDAFKFWTEGFDDSASSRGKANRRNEEHVRERFFGESPIFSEETKDRLFHGQLDALVAGRGTGRAGQLENARRNQEADLANSRPATFRFDQNFAPPSKVDVRVKVEPSREFDVRVEQRQRDRSRRVAQ